MEKTVSRENPYLSESYRKTLRSYPETWRKKNGAEMKKDDGWRTAFYCPFCAELQPLQCHKGGVGDPFIECSKHGKVIFAREQIIKAIENAKKAKSEQNV